MQLVELGLEVFEGLRGILVLEGFRPEHGLEEVLRLVRRRFRDGVPSEDVLVFIKETRDQVAELADHGIARGNCVVVDNRHRLVENPCRETGCQLCGHAPGTEQRLHPRRDGDPRRGDFPDRSPQAVLGFWVRSLIDELHGLCLDLPEVEIGGGGIYAGREIHAYKGDLDLEVPLEFPDEGTVRGQRLLVAKRPVHGADGPRGEGDGILPGAERLQGDVPCGIAVLPRDGLEKGVARAGDLVGTCALRPKGGRGREAVAGLDEPHRTVSDRPALFLGRVGQIEERLICCSGSVHVDVLVEDAYFRRPFYGLLFFALITRFNAKGYRSRFSAVPALSPQNIRGGFRREENVHLRLSPPSPVRA